MHGPIVWSNPISSLSVSSEPWYRNLWLLRPTVMSWEYRIKFPTVEIKWFILFDICLHLCFFLHNKYDEIYTSKISRSIFYFPRDPECLGRQETA